MKTVRLSRDRANRVLAVLRELRQGGAVICPSDTCYIFAADGLNTDAVRRVWELKGPQRRGPIHVVVSDLEMAERVVYLDEPALKLLTEPSLAPVTVVLPKKPCVPDDLTGGTGSLGVRLPRCQLLIDLAWSLGSPLTATSANPSGGRTPYSLDEVVAQVPPIRLPRMAIDSGPLPAGLISTVVDLTVRPPRLIREGSTPFNLIVDMVVVANTTREKTS
jgi:L-threonylcarbamoyladenylate synthase